MHLRPIRLTVPVWITRPLEWLFTGLFLAFFGIPILLVVGLARLEDRISSEWHPHFAWWPTRCDDWLNDGFVGTVWLEKIERRNKFPHGLEYRRKVAQVAAREGTRVAAQVSMKDPGGQNPSPRDGGTT